MGVPTPSGIHRQSMRGAKRVYKRFNQPIANHDSVLEMAHMLTP
jgi:hypothetical protein